ncbi:MAG TPA: serine/threonine-protein kinase [Steroidobacteraceae bacterium]|nr:serine/threonine-protein kinase [Steroidobacteraceae bacterium]
MGDRAEAWQELQTLFELIDRTPEPERERVLDSACTDSALRARVLRMVHGANQDRYSATGPLPAAVSACAELPQRLGPYTVLRVIGAGGIGTVYLAERHLGGAPQRVAIKVLAPHAAGRQFVDRFHRERHILAMLDHPNITRLLDAGISDSGQPYLVMDFVDGVHLDEYCDRGALSVQERVRLFLQVCEAIAHAHRNLVVHLDLKPSNILVNAQGVVKLLDFGTSKLIQPDDSVTTTILATPTYASPEQLRNEPLTTASDIYSLGATLFCLLTGEVEGGRRSAAIAIERAFKGLQPQHLSTARIDHAAARSRATTLPRLQRLLRGDIDSIVRRCLRPDAADRYSSVDALVQDLRRYLEGRAILARPQTALYLGARFLRRHRLGTALAALALVATGLLAGATLLQTHRATQAREMAAQRGQFLEHLLTSANPGIGRRDVMVSDLLDKVMNQSDADISSDPLVAASVLGVVSRTEKALGRYPEALALNDRQMALVRGGHGDPRDLIDALNIRSLLLLMSGHVREAEAPTRETLALLHDKCTVDGAYADTLDILGEIQRTTLQDDAADSTFRRELACARTFQTRRWNERAVHALNNIMIVNKSRGDFAAALASGEAAVALGKKSMSADAPYLMTTELNLADTIAAAHRPVEAEALLRDLLARRARVLGPQHAETLMTEVSLANDLYLQNRYQEAVATALPAATGLGAVLGPGHQVTAGAWQVYGNAACRAGEPAAGLAALRTSEAGKKTRFGADTWQTQGVEADIGVCLGLMHRFAEAEPVLLAAARGLEASRGENFYLTQAAFADLRELYAAQGDATNASLWAARIHTPATLARLERSSGP